MLKEFNNRIKCKRYQELSRPYRILLWIRYMPFGYIKGIGWYYVKRLRWENMYSSPDEDDYGRMSLETCIGINVGMAQSNMNWFYKTDEVFTNDGELIRRHDNDSFLQRMFDFIEEKLIEIIDGKKVYD